MCISYTDYLRGKNVIEITISTLRVDTFFGLHIHSAFSLIRLCRGYFYHLKLLLFLRKVSNPPERVFVFVNNGRIYERCTKRSALEGELKLWREILEKIGLKIIRCKTKFPDFRFKM